MANPTTTRVSDRRNTYTGYSIGCAAVWAVILAVGQRRLDPKTRNTLWLACGGWWSGWTSATIARISYPPPKQLKPGTGEKAWHLLDTADRNRADQRHPVARQWQATGERAPVDAASYKRRDRATRVRTPLIGQRKHAGAEGATATLNNMPAAVPCYVYLRGDPDAIHCNEAPDEVLRRIEEAAPDEFVHLAMTAYAHDDAIRTGYARAGDVVAILPMHPRQLEASLDDPPSWYHR